MDAVTSTTQTQSQAPAASTNTSSVTDYETFLTLLTAQLRNQNPLNPMESTEFVAQLATFTSVEQQILTNTKLDGLTSALRESDVSALGGWIGREVAVEGPIPFNGTPVTPEFDADAPTGARLVVRDGLGEIVSDQPYGSGTWTGTLNNGLQASPGTYSFELRGPAAQGDRLIANGYGFATVEEARFSPDGNSLRLSDGRDVPASSVSALR
ncbi:flagellar hook capping FlgD N-terminal domain-containing protein [Pontivivens ytuae]|uniref:Basal-body rod modification protein FlgD n=1 Tax=Pontivivens ytuae TaxID=2789856 RepID=A0A7S9QBT0_9RHOB|nr:flagellar hook capping FlgD N-terminal domain-containing protein [Pontivivens ytuae]QPH53075.1 flagellar hook assembly protein FlgD [Pontivivens ytuae]